jgi:hypothetical protein
MFTIAELVFAVPCALFFVFRCTLLGCMMHVCMPIHRLGLPGFQPFPLKWLTLPD